jgi:peptidoglycan/xylan/chitin deacetylase (PgdA/CDA1 family)
VYSILYALSYLPGMRPKLVVLCYHSVGEDDWWFTVSMKNLRQQMDYMLQYYEPVALSDLEDFLLGKKALTKPSFAVTFDDGYQDILQTKEMFKEMKICPTVFVIADPANANYGELENKREFLDKKGVNELQDAGWEVGSHSMTHSDFSKLDTAGVAKEVVESKQRLEKDLEIPIKYIAYPRGNYTNLVLKSVAKAGYILGMSMDDTLLCKDTNKLLVPRVGINGTHTFAEFVGTISVPAICMRAIVKAIL